jgi:hypothetical protein
MGWQVGTACYGSEASAVAAIASAEVGSVRQSGSALYAVDVVGITDASIAYSLTPIDGGPALPAVTVPVTLQPCGLVEFGDSMLMAWAIVAGWAGTYAIKFLSGVVRGHDT